jgi:hypothetical protein
VIPPTYMLALPTHSRTQTFAGGPQLAYRHFSKVTLFIRPELGAIYEVATPQPTDAVARAIVAQLAPSGKKTDWTVFYGFGGGTDLLFPNTSPCGCRQTSSTTTSSATCCKMAAGPCGSVSVRASTSARTLRSESSESGVFKKGIIHQGMMPFCFMAKNCANT